MDYKLEQYFSLTPNQPAVIIHSRNEQAPSTHVTVPGCPPLIGLKSQNGRSVARPSRIAECPPHTMNHQWRPGTSLLTIYGPPTEYNQRKHKGQTFTKSFQPVPFLGLFQHSKRLDFPGEGGQAIKSGEHHCKHSPFFSIPLVTMDCRDWSAFGVRVNSSEVSRGMPLSGQNDSIVWIRVVAMFSRLLHLKSAAGRCE